MATRIRGLIWLRFGLYVVMLVYTCSAAKSAVEERHFDQQLMAQERKLAGLQAAKLAVCVCALLARL
jgi:hypothetical protein